MFNSLNTDFGMQQHMMHYIENAIVHKETSIKRKMMGFTTIIAWLFLFYHLILLSANIAYYGKYERLRINPLFGLLNRLDDWYSV